MGISVLPAAVGFAGGMAGWGFILNEIFNGEAGGTAKDCNEYIASSFNNMRMIVTVGWSIYPLGYLFGYLLGAVDDVFLNVIYNIADMVNKIACVLVLRQGGLRRQVGGALGMSFFYFSLLPVYPA